MESLAVKNINRIIKKKRNLVKICSVGKKCHDVFNWDGDKCFCIEFLYELDNLTKMIDGEDSTM